MASIRPLGLARLMAYSLASFVPAASGAARSSHVADAASSRSSRVGPFTSARVRVALSPKFNRQRHPDPRVEASVEQLWAAHKAASPRIFNGTKFRLHAWRVCHGESPALELQCGLTDYKAYLGTCCSDQVSALRADGAKMTESGDPMAFLSRKIGISALVETSDRRVALIERSRSVGVYQQLFDTPGGHPEPADLPFTTEALETINRTEKEMMKKVVDRLFGSIVDEVHEEINLSPAQLSDPLLLGIVFQSVAETPSFVFHLTTALTSAEVDALYQLGPQDKFESTQLRWVDTTMLDAFSLTPAAQGSLSLWQQYCAFRSW